MNANVRTWADASGTWHARVPVSDRSVVIARDLIRDELQGRQAAPLGVFDVETVEETDTHVTYREVWPDEFDLTSSASRQTWIETGHFLPVAATRVDRVAAWLSRYAETEAAYQVACDETDGDPDSGALWAHDDALASLAHEAAELLTESV